MTRALVAAALTVALGAPLGTSVMANARTADAVDSARVSGVVTELVAEAPDHARGGEETDLALATPDGFVPLADGIDVAPGQHVTAEVRGGEAADVVATRAAREGSTPAVLDRRVYVGIVSPAGYTLADNTNTVASVQRTLASASDYWGSQTGGAVTFEYGGTLGKYVSEHPCGDTTAMWNEAIEKFADEGVDVLGPGRYLMLVAPTGSSATDDCQYGYGTLGGLEAARNATFVSDDNQSLYAHELGHNLGLAHASALRCAGAQDGVWNGRTYGSNCARWRYEDLLDVMGYSGKRYGEGNLNAPHLDDLGLDPGAIRAVAGPATVTIPPLSDTTAPGRGLRLTDTNGERYYVEYRTATGRDAVWSLNPYKPSLGVLLYREDPSAYHLHGSYHLDATPLGTDSFDYDRALLPGTMFTTGTGTLTVTTIRQDENGAVVEIAGGASDVDPELPVGSSAHKVRLSGPSVARRSGWVRLTAVVLSETGAVVPGSRVSFQRRTDEGWRTVRTTTTSRKGVARVKVRLRQSTTFRVAAGTPVAPSRSVTVRLPRTRS
ncbi:hypothetical protein [Nocardioides sp. SR21]|uniref:hypothetical protein n=1 Tax=Nocardioides sp. SR21 TaxID=2919501 RepID=UPI001FA94CA2|nr:hypothetical protein [Nocardioides sp. SR21]